MKNDKASATIFYIAAVLFYLAAIVSFVGGNHDSNGIIWLCFGSTFLCLGSARSKRSKEKQDDEEKEDK